ncbi:hypothetical protein ASE74_21550 [Pedobacter sp. Leaf216]|nr:hypothetical protein ASE74_21550 [Pedobacter sp. Leaf216]
MILFITFLLIKNAAEQKKHLLNQKCPIYFDKDMQTTDLTIPDSSGMELAPFLTNSWLLRLHRAIPSAFLDKYFKITAAKV